MTSSGCRLRAERLAEHQIRAGIHAIPHSGAIRLAQGTQVSGQVAGRAQGIGVVLAEHPALAVQGVLVQVAGRLILPEVSSMNTSRGIPAAVAVSNSSSVKDTFGLSGTGEPYRCPAPPHTPGSRAPAPRTPAPQAGQRQGNRPCRRPRARRPRSPAPPRPHRTPSRGSSAAQRYATRTRATVHHHLGHPSQPRASPPGRSVPAIKSLSGIPDNRRIRKRDTGSVVHRAGGRDRPGYRPVCFKGATGRPLVRP